MAIKTITVDGTTYDIGVTVTNIEGTLPVSKGGTGRTSTPSLLTNLGSTSASNPFASAPRPGVTGTLPVSNGGTGVTSTPSLLTNLGSTSASNPFASAPRPGVTGTLPISRGGTGATTAAAAKTALGIEDTDTKVTQTASTASGGYPILFSKQSATRSTWSNVTDGAYVDPAIAINPSHSKIIVRATNYANSTNGSGFHTYDVDNDKYVASLCSSIQGTTSTVGRGILMLGNNTASGTAGNSQGRIYLYGSNTGWAAIQTAVGATNRLYTVPDAGASADFIMGAGAQTISGNKTFSGIAYFGGGTTYYVNASANAKFNTLTAAGAATFSSTSTHTGAATFNNKIIGKSGSVSAGNYTTTIPTAAGTAGQIMFVLQ